MLAVPNYGGNVSSLYRAWAERGQAVFKDYEDYAQTILNKLIGTIVIGNIPAGGDNALHTLILDHIEVKHPVSAILLQSAEYGLGSLYGNLIESEQVKSRLDNIVRMILKGWEKARKHAHRVPLKRAHRGNPMRARGYINHGYRPPAPFVAVTTSFDELNIEAELPLLLDTGASSTIILWRDVERLKINTTLIRGGDKEFTGLGGLTKAKSTPTTISFTSEAGQLSEEEAEVFAISSHARIKN